MKQKTFIPHILLALVLIGGFMFPSSFAFAATTNFEISGWLPYWKVSEGIKDAQLHVSQLAEVHPFGFAIKDDGNLKDLFGLSKSNWKKFIKSARAKDVRIVPTVMSSDGDQIQQLLSDPKSRAKHIKAIVSMVKKGRYDGVDINYEGKKAETKDLFSTFLKELKTALGDKMLTCAIEARTPADSLYATIPTDIQYANDLTAIGTYCDRVQIMTYDQRDADIKLNVSKAASPYIPLADVDWVRKVANLMSQSIPKEKLMLGVATYGQEYEVVMAPDGTQTYNRLWALNPSYGVDTAKQFNITPNKNSAGEMSFSYPSIWKFPESLIIPANTPSGEVTAARARAYAKLTGKTVSFYYITWSDAGAIQDKVNLAHELGLRGVSLFKIDGGEDQAAWDILK